MKLRSAAQTYFNWRASSLAVTLLTAVSIAPAFLVDIPAMTDYLNHLARMHILATAGTPEANPFYQVEWRFYPNLAMDLIVPQLARLVSVETAAKTFFVCSQLLVVTGAIAIELAIKSKHQLSGFAALMVLYSAPLSSGLLNFEFGIGLALWAVASWLAGGNRSWWMRLAVHSFFVFVLFLSHFFALGVYGATIGIYELWRLLSRKVDFGQAALALFVMAAPVIVVIGAMAIWGIDSTVEVPAALNAPEWSFTAKLVEVCCSMTGASTVLSLVGSASIIFLIYLLLREGGLSFFSAGKWIAVGYLLLFIALPVKVFNTGAVDIRILLVAALVLPAFLYLPKCVGRARYAALLVAASQILSNDVYIAYRWSSFQPDYAALKSSFALIEKHARVLVGHSSTWKDLSESPIHFAPTLAVHYAKALVPSLYTTAQPVKLRNEFRRYRIQDGTHYRPIPFALLRQIQRNGATPQSPAYVREWSRDYDYIYLVGAPIQNPMPKLLRKLAAGERFALYRIVKPGIPGLSMEEKGPAHNR